MSATGTTLNVSDLIDSRKLSGLQILTLILCAMVTFIDGMDTQSIGIVARPLADQLGFGMASFGVVASAGLVGAAIGALTFGRLGDRFGRKIILIGAALLFGCFTIATAWAPDYGTLLLLRVLAGIGLGGAMPNVVALNSEYAPKRIRAFMVLLQWSSFPGGGFIGGIIARYLLQHYTWQFVFYFGGGLALFIALCLLLFLPESLKFLISRNASQERISGIVNKIAPNASTSTTRFTLAEETVAQTSIGALFAEGRTIITLSLWATFAIAFAILLFTPNWTGPLLGGEGGLAGPDVALIVTVHNLGSMLGGIVAGWLMDRFNPYRVLAPALLCGMIFTSMTGYAAMSDFTLFQVIVAIAGFFIGVGGNGAVALAAMLYPTPVRATGMGWAVSFARLGQVASSILAGMMIGAGLTPEKIFALIGSSALVAALAVVVIWVRNPQRY